MSIMTDRLEENLREVAAQGATVDECLLALKRVYGLSEMPRPTTRIDLMEARIVYHYENGTSYDQPVADIFQVGTLIDPDDGENLEPQHLEVPLRTELNPLKTTIDAASDQPLCHEYSIVWENIADGTSPAEAARDLWRDSFTAADPIEQPSSDNACVFTVSLNDQQVEIDLADERFADLFEGKPGGLGSVRTT